MTDDDGNGSHVPVIASTVFGKTDTVVYDTPATPITNKYW